jgi:hypothetical protein
MTELAKPIGWLTRARSSGALPLLVGLGALVVFYQSVNPHDPVAGGWCGATSPSSRSRESGLPAR